MALTDSQKMTIIRLLCYPNGTLDSGSLDYSNIIVGKLNRITGEAEIEVEKILAWIDETETQLDAVIGSQRVKRVDDIEFFEDQSGLLKQTLAKYKRELSQFIGIPSRCGGGSMGRVCV